MALYPTLSDNSANTEVILDYIYQALVSSGSTSVTVSGHTDLVRISHPNEAALYAATRCVGTYGEAAVLRTPGTAILNDFTVFDTSAQAASLTILLFNSQPSGTYEDNVTPVISSDKLSMIGKIEIAAGDYKTIGTASFAHITGLNFVLKSEAGPNIYYVIVANGAPNYGADALTLRFGVLQD